MAADAFYLVLRYYPDIVHLDLKLYGFLRAQRYIPVNIIQGLFVIVANVKVAEINDMLRLNTLGKV